MTDATNGPIRTADGPADFRIRTTTKSPVPAAAFPWGRLQACRKDGPSTIDGCWGNLCFFGTCPGIDR